MVLSDEIAVMHEGRLLQIAAPETIYARPATRTVAAFFGTPNLLSAKVREVRREAGALLARVDGEGWEGWCAAPAEVQAGDVVTVVVRPEVMRFGGIPPTPGATWTGAVRQRVFRGARIVYLVESGALEMAVETPPDQSFAPGTPVTLSVDAPHTWAVRE
jgi:iron(III) transport system ATP-binding protein